MAFLVTGCLYKGLVHASDEVVDELLTVASITTLGEVSELLNEATSGASELEGPEEARGLSEVRSRGENLVDDILNADEAIFAERSLDDAVVSDGNALLVDVGETALVDELADGLEGGVAESDVGLDNAEHLKNGLGQTDEDTIVELAQAQELQDLAGLGAHVVDTADTDHESDLSLGLHEERTGVLSITTSLDQLQLACAVLLSVLLSTLEDHLAGGRALLRRSCLSGLLVGELLGLNLLALKHSLGDGATHKHNTLVSLHSSQATNYYLFLLFISSLLSPPFSYFLAAEDISRILFTSISHTTSTTRVSSNPII